MKKLNITVSPYDSYTDDMVKEQAGNYTYGEYDLYHNFSVWNFITINGVDHQAMYQTACSYLHNDYSCPNPELELADTNFGTHELLTLVDSLYASDFDDSEYINAVLADAQHLCKDIDTVCKLRQVYDCLIDNAPMVAEYENFYECEKLI